MDKVRILFYSGHHEIVGGDAQYLLNLVENLNSDQYAVEIYTDKNAVFEERVKQWLSRDVIINYLDTRPILFKKNLVQKLYDKVTVHQSGSKMASIVKKILDADCWLEHSVYRWINYLYYRTTEIITLAKIRAAAHNAILFYKLFKSKKEGFDIFHFNNGGYPAKTSVLVAVIVAYCLGVKNIVMTTCSIAQPKRWYSFSDYAFDWVIPRCCKKVITLSEFLSIEFNRRRKFPLNKLHAIVLGTKDAKALTPDEIVKKKQALGLWPDQPILSVVGAIYGAAKGHNVLFEAMREVKKQFPKATLLVVGDGKGKAALQRLADELSLGDNIHFLGYRQDLGELNNIIDIAVVPSTAAEGVPYTCLEALRAGKALITTDAGGCAEAVRPGTTGLVIKKNDASALAEAIIKLLSNRSLLGDMGKEGRKLFEAKFSLSRVVQNHAQLYRELLNK